MISPRFSSPLSPQSRVAGVVIVSVRVPSTPGNRRQQNNIDVQWSQNEVKAFYDRYSNQLLYSALHGLTAKPVLDGDSDTYRAVNERYAAAVLRELRAGGLVWVHDYHLMLVPYRTRSSVVEDAGRPVCVFVRPGARSTGHQHGDQESLAVPRGA